MKWLDFQEVKPTLILALPIVAGNVSGMLMGWVDTLMVGRLGVIPLAAVAFAGTIWMFFYFMGAGCVLAVCVRAAKAHGAQDLEALRGWLASCLIIAVVMGILTTITGWICMELFPFLGQQPEVLKASRGFYIYVILSLIPAFIGLGLKTFLDALGRPWIGLWSLIFSIVINIFFNWLLIFGNWGFPRLELTGAGIATLLARIFGTIFMIIAFLITPYLRNLLLGISNWSWEAIHSLMHIGTLISLQMLSEIIAFSLGTIIIGWMGAVPLAAHQIAITMAGTTYMIPLGVGTALTIRIANLLGAGQHQHLPGTVYGTIFTTCVFMGCLGALVIVFSSYIPSWFIDSTDVQHIASQLLIIMGTLQIMDALYILSQSALRGLSDVHFPAFTIVFTYLGFGLLCAYALGVLAKWQAPGVWIGLFLGTTLSAILCFWRLRKKIAQAVLAPF